MLSLSLSDLANGCTVMPISAAVCSKASPNVRNMLQYLPTIQEICTVWFMFTLMHSLCWVTVCKMVAVTRPLRYEQILTRRRCCFILAGIWVSGAVMATALSPPASNWILDTCMYGLPTASKRPTNFAALMIFHLAVVVILPVIVYATATIFRVIVRTHRQIAAQTNSIGGHIDLVNIPSLTSKSIRSGRNILIICLAYVVLTIPVAIYLIAAVVGEAHDVPPSFEFVAIWAVFCNSFVNSCLYLFLFRYVRSKAKDMFKSIRSGKNVLIICLAYIVLSIPAAVYITAVSVGKGNDMPAYFQFVAVWTVFCNSFVNSFFYLFFFRSVRTKVKVLTNACMRFEFQ